MKSVSGVLRGARKLLTTAGWVKGDDHRVENGESKFCARGAVQIAAGGQVNTVLRVTEPSWFDPEGQVKQFTEVDLSYLDHAAYNEAMHVLSRVANKTAQERGWYAEGLSCDIVGANDLPGSTLDDVLSIFDEAIALHEAEQVVNQYNAQSVSVGATAQYDDDYDC